jgi:NADPH:quinone reductase-like Zn-dependent oxidoreductase
MKVFELRNGFGLENLGVATRPTPNPGPGQVLLKIRAIALNYRDLLLVKGIYNPRLRLPVVPFSDAAGEVAAVGAGVTRFRVGDRALNPFFPHWLDGPANDERLSGALGGGSEDGVAMEYRVFAESALAPIPDDLGFTEAATLPCAGLTAYSAIATLGDVQPSDTVLIQGTGGVALFALQFVKLRGAFAIVTSSSDAKLERASALGADLTINYVREPEWGVAARKLNGRRGLDLIVEIGGAATLDRSLRAVRAGGMVALIGVVSGAQQSINLPLILMRQVRLQGVTVGSRAGLEAMLADMSRAKLRPVIDRVFAFDEVGDALGHMEQGAHFGKIVLEL